MSLAPGNPEAPRNEGTEPEASGAELSRRSFVKGAGLVGVGLAGGLQRVAEAQMQREAAGSVPHMVSVNLLINGSAHRLEVDTRTTVLDALRNELELTGTKKGCDHGQCGACTVLLNGRRVNSCLTLAVCADGIPITSVEGLASGKTLSAVQTAFLEHDAFQCGYCTPGQICSATALLEEARRGNLSIVSYRSGSTSNPQLTDDEIRERMSGNLCRCGAYPNIVAAVRAAARSSAERA